MKIIANRSTLNLATLTYGQLKDHFPSTKGMKLPTEKALREKEPLFIVTDDGAQVNVYEDGFLAYLKRDETGKLRATVYAVDRCDHITYEHGSSKEEYEDVDPETKLWTFGTCKVSYKMVKRQLVRIHTVPETEYTNSHWLLPVSIICGERMIRNANSRSASKIEFHADNDGDDWNEAMAVQGPEEMMIEAEEEAEADARKQKDHETLEEAMKALTEVQRKTIQLYYYTEGGITEAGVAEILGTSQQNVHKNLMAAMKKLRKFF